jgi:sugar phosphate isomerase/epimerase
MYLTGIGDEAGAALDAQIAATKELGWDRIELRAVEVPGYPKANVHELPEAAFDALVRRIKETGLAVCCFGSAIMNWAKKVEDPFDITLGEVRRAIPRMQKLNTKLVRIMSFKPGDDEARTPRVVFERVREVTTMFLDAGIQPVHENCMNYGGMSWEHALELLSECPGLKWVFDTANPIFNPDRRGPKPWPRQDPWEFWIQVRDYTAHIHVKDATWNAVKNNADYNWPGEGAGQVRDILKDALLRGYDAGISIEPHMVTVFHDPTAGAASGLAAHENFVEYGRRLERMVAEIRAELGRRSPVAV